MTGTRGGTADQRRAMDAIAERFDVSRDQPWTPVVEFIETLPDGSTVLDVGGGNGRHALVAARLGHRALVLDASGRLVRLAAAHAQDQEQDLGAFEGDLVHLPVATDSVDHAVFVAALHCVPTRRRRRVALLELARVVRLGGRVLVTVWARDQPRFRQAMDAQASRLAARDDGGDAPSDDGEEPGDVIVPWRHGMDQEVERFFHLYTLEELVQDLKATGWQVEATEAVALGGQHLDNLVAVARVG